MTREEKYSQLLKKLEKYKNFSREKIEKEDLKYFEELSILARADILKMTTISSSGHIGGALSTIDLYLLLWLCLSVNKERVNDPERDIVIISNGHTSAAVYIALGIYGFFDINDAIFNFRRADSIFEGHPGNRVPGVEWCSGNLGQGLSVGCGYAYALKKKNFQNKVFVVMGDGEQQKGQISEAIRFANKFNLGNLVSFIDYNHLQASGDIDNIMPNNIARNYKNGNWEVTYTDGHNFEELYKVLREVYLKRDKPQCIIAKTIMCKGIKSLEGKYEYHGKCLSIEQYNEVIKKFKLNPDISDEYVFEDIKTIDTKRKEYKLRQEKIQEEKKNSIEYKKEKIEEKINTNIQEMYPLSQLISNRDAFGNALLQLGNSNTNNDQDPPIIVMDCDLSPSVRTDKFNKRFPGCFIQGGIAEHNIASVAGSISKNNFLTFLAGFGVFGVDEIYNQMRLNDINNTSIKLVCTHNGVEVGEDGKTHQCIDYISLISNLFNFKIVIPADANQTVHITNYIASNHGNFLMVLNRSKIPIISNKSGGTFFEENYDFSYGGADWVRNGKDGTIISYGHMIYRAVRAAEILKKENSYDVGVLNISCPLALDDEKIFKASETGAVLVYEDHNVRTGLGTILGSYIAENNLNCSFQKMGIRKYGISGNSDYQYNYQEINVPNLVKKFIELKNNNN